MEIKYRCLILDHDDTAVDSTQTVHYPAHIESMRVLRPNHRPISLRGWFLKNFHPGITTYLSEELKLTPVEREVEFGIWQRFTRERVPRFYSGFCDFLKNYRQRGGLIAVVSHSEREVIASHYRRHASNGDIFPDLIFGWEDNPELRKPSPYPVKQILEKFRLNPREALILDDLKPGVLMGRATGVPVAAAGWSHRIDEIQQYMKKNCLTYFSSINELESFIIGHS